MRGSLAARMCLPARIAVTAPGSDRLRWTPTWSGRNSPPWRKARASPRRNSGGDLRALFAGGCLSVGGRDELFRDQKDARQDQSIDHCDRNHANREVTEVIIQVGAQHVAKARGDEIEAARHHQRRPLQARWTRSNEQV